MWQWLHKIIVSVTVVCGWRNKISVSVGVSVTVHVLKASSHLPTCT